MKQVIVVDESLGLPRGKLAAQVAHGSVAAFLEASPEARAAWLDDGMTKVVLKGEDRQELERLKELAEGAGLPCALIHDAGRTLLPEGTVTCLALGPAEERELDRLTGSLPLVE